MMGLPRQVKVLAFEDGFFAEYFRNVFSHDEAKAIWIERGGLRDITIKLEPAGVATARSAAAADAGPEVRFRP